MMNASKMDILCSMYEVIILYIWKYHVPIGFSEKSVDKWELAQHFPRECFEKVGSKRLR